MTEAENYGDGGHSFEYEEVKALIESVSRPRPPLVTACRCEIGDQARAARSDLPIEESARLDFDDCGGCAQEPAEHVQAVQIRW